jgi:4-hydroxy-tetrahydrodipicolinate reductase
MQKRGRIPSAMTREVIRIAVAGAAGRMGREVIRAVMEAEGLPLVAAVDKHEAGRDAGELTGMGSLNVPILSDLDTALTKTEPDVLVDFTLPDSVMTNVRTALEHGVSPVVGTTGLSAENLAEIDHLARQQGVGAFVAPNFAIGAVLMMQFAAQAARYLPDVEIIELHHEKKLDSPSGTALLTAQQIAQARREAGVAPQPAPAGTVEKAPGARGAHGAATGEVPIHSVRLPGFVAHQEVIFGGPGQILTLRHDSTDRRSFMPGVLLAIRKVRALQGLVVGLEHLL